MKLIVLLGLLVSLSACNTVHPWKRGILAKPEMAWVVDSHGSALSNHVYFSKEGSTGGVQSAGGGCGCN